MEPVVFIGLLALVAVGLPQGSVTAQAQVPPLLARERLPDDVDERNPRCTAHRRCYCTVAKEDAGLDAVDNQLHRHPYFDGLLTARRNRRRPPVRNRTHIDPARMVRQPTN